MTDLCTRITDYIWYTASHSDKFRKCGAAIPPFFEPLLPFKNPKRHKHTDKKLRKAILLQHLNVVSTLMEKSFTNRASSAVIKTEIESLIPSGVKFCDHLESCLVSAQASKSIADGPVYESTVKTLPQVSQSVETVYINKRERKVILDIEEKLSELECYERICVDEYFSLKRAQKYIFVKRVLENGLTIKCALFSQSYKGYLGNTYFMWREDMTYESNRTGVV